MSNLNLSLSESCERKCILCGKINQNDLKFHPSIDCHDHQPLCSTCIINYYGKCKKQTCIVCDRQVDDTIMYSEGALKVRENIKNKCCCVCYAKISIGETFQVCTSRPVVYGCSICLSCYLDYDYNKFLKIFCECRDESVSISYVEDIDAYLLSRKRNQNQEQEWKFKLMKI